ncbi:unnamed protein product [Rhizophagus irregularis]|nr:unnamed protein product [Rhizophagus irregularis]
MNFLLNKNFSEQFSLFLKCMQLNKIYNKAAMRKFPNIPALKWNNFLTNAFSVSTALDTDNHIFSRPNIITKGLSKLSESLDNFDY